MLRVACCVALVVGNATGCQWIHRGIVNPKISANSRKLTLEASHTLSQGRSKEAEKLAKKAALQCPHNSEAQLLWANLLWRRGETNEAIRRLEAASNYGEEPSVPLLIRLSEMALQAGQYDLAEGAIQRAIDAEPQSSASWLLYATFWELRGKPSLAMAAYQRVLAIEPHQTVALQQIAGLYRNEGKVHESLACLHQLAGIFPPDEMPRDALVMKGLNLMDMAEPAEAATSFAQAARYPHPSAEILHLLATAEMEAGNLQRAIEANGTALQIDPAHPPSHQLRQYISLPAAAAAAELASRADANMVGTNTR